MTRAYNKICIENKIAEESDGWSTVWTCRGFRQTLTSIQWEFLNRTKSAVTLGYGRDEECMSEHHKADFTDDFVEGILCLNWPIQIQKWLERERKYDWPNEVTRLDVIRNGCHIISSPDTDNPECWKISFSKAEHTLINTWTREQQMASGGATPGHARSNDLVTKQMTWPLTWP